MRRLLTLLPLLVFATPALAATTLLSPHVYMVDEGVEFQISNDGVSSFLFNWSDSSGSFVDVPDPSFVLVINETYIFRRTTSAHPFVITDDTLPVDGTDGSYFRTTTDGAVIDAATLPPIADFTADPAPTTDQITWLPDAGYLGNYYYTCRVTAHPNMTGSIRIIEPTVPTTKSSWAGVKALY